MKALIICFALFFCIVNEASGQGAEAVPELVYEKLPSPPIEAGSGEDALKEYIIPASLFPTPGKQGKDFSCVGWAVSYAYFSYLHNLKNSHPATLAKGEIFSPSYLYKSLKSCTGCSCGIRMDKALEFLKSTGNVPISIYPYNGSDCSIPPDLKTTAAAYRIKDYYRLEGALNFTEIKNDIQNNVPVLTIIKANPAFKAYKDQKETHPYDDQNVLDYEFHAVVIVGFSEKKKAFKILNSYGNDWGTKGYAWITYASLRKIIKEAYIILESNANALLTAQKQEMTGSLTAGAANINVNKPIDSTSFKILGTRDSIRKDRYHYTYKINADPATLSQVSKVTYFYDHPTFVNKYSTSRRPPFFQSSYDGWGCLNKIKVSITLKNDSVVKISFNGCAVLLDSLQQSRKPDFQTVEINPYVTAKSIGKDLYDFHIDLRGINQVEPYIDSVKYLWDHPTFKNPVTSGDERKHYSNGYRGWGCLSYVKIVIYFENGYRRYLNVNMCSTLGWTDADEEIKKNNLPDKR